MTTTNFALMLQNGLLVLVHGTKFSKSIEETSKEELNVCLTSFSYTSPRMTDGTHSKSSSKKSIRAAIDRFLCSPPLEKPFALASSKVDNLIKQLTKQLVRIGAY